VRDFKFPYESDQRYLDDTEKELSDSTVSLFPEKSSPPIRESSARRYVRAAKAAGEYREKSGYNEPGVRGKTPVREAIFDVQSFGYPYGGTVTPSQKGTLGPPGAGGVNRMRKQKPSIGKSFAPFTFFG
jgi:hypothetical protein